jgi:type II secretory pathway component PulJ
LKKLFETKKAQRERLVLMIAIDKAFVLIALVVALKINSLLLLLFKAFIRLVSHTNESERV